MGSLEDAILDNPERFLAYAKDIDNQIKDLGALREALHSAFDTARGHNVITEQALLTLWETKECKEMVADNTTPEEYEKVYGDGIMIKREIIKEKIVTIRQPRIKVQPHFWKGQSVKGYNKSYRKWTNAEVKFLQIRKAKKVTPIQTIAEFDKHFKDKRSSSSISTKLYRL